jgi:transcriptional regulator with XRE-family HTH domain
MKMEDTADVSREHYASLYTAAQKVIGQNLFNAMQVAGEREGESTKMTQRELVERTGIARSTIAKYIAGKDTASAANPDLETLCRLARALNVSPGLLLLTPDDWEQLAQAAQMMLQAADDEVILEAVEELRNGRGRAIERGTCGLKILERADLYTPNSPGAPAEAVEMRPKLIKEQRAEQSMKRKGIAVASAVAPLGQLKPQYHVPVLWMCAYLGAATNFEQSRDR